MLQVIEASNTDHQKANLSRNYQESHSDQNITDKSPKRRVRRGSMHRDSGTSAFPVSSSAMPVPHHKHRVPLYHLKGREQRKYTDTPGKEPSLSLFDVKLEILNRRAVRKIKRPHPEGDEITELSEWFYECAGKAKVTSRLCSKCRDGNKSSKRYDNYFIDLVEISQQRTVYCDDCMSEIINEQVKGSISEIRDELNLLRVNQPNGVYVDPFSLSCGL